MASDRDNATATEHGQATDAEHDEHEREARTPDAPTDLPRRGWLAVLKRTVKEFQADNLTDLAAALTYYGVLSIFPMLIVLVSILGLVGHSATEPLVQNLGKVAPGPAKDIFTSAIHNVDAAQGTAGAAFVFGIVLALWSASSYIAAFMRASNIVWDVEEGRPIWKTIPVRLAVTLVTVVLLTIAALAVVFTGGLARQVGDLIGVGSTAVQVWDIAKWPVLVVILIVILGILYWAAPNVKQPGWRWISPGGILAVLLWLLASALFALYVANFSSYNKTYGALASVVVFLIWLWISNTVILLGSEFNAELARERQIRAGRVAADDEPFLPARDAPKE
jgi:membrane protein